MSTCVVLSAAQPVSPSTIPINNQDLSRKSPENQRNLILIPVPGTAHSMDRGKLMLVFLSLDVGQMLQTRRECFLTIFLSQYHYDNTKDFSSKRAADSK